MIMEAATQDIAFTTPSDREAVLTRVFDAPRDLVFRTVLDPDLIADWWGPKRFSVRVDRMDVRQGGAWRFVLRDSVSRVFTFHGEFREVAAPERVSYTLEFEAFPGHAVVETAQFDDVGGDRTRVTFTSLFASQADRDVALRWGVRDGALEAVDRFADLLKRCAARPSAGGGQGLCGVEPGGTIASVEAGTGGDARPD
jgi:uncharacterized protein YndB with AHSA1/START domain